MTGAASLRRGGVEDISYIMATERQPGYDVMVGRWTEAAHLVSLANPAYAYLIGTDGAGRSGGFAIFRDLDDPHGNVCLKRIAVERPGADWAARFCASPSAGPSPKPRLVVPANHPIGSDRAGAGPNRIPKEFPRKSRKA